MKLDHLLLVSTSSRPVDYSRCSYDALKSRYSDEGRLESIPRLSDLSALLDGHASYDGSLSVYHLSGSEHHIRLRFIKKVVGNGKIQHGIISGNTLVICYEDRVEFMHGWDRNDASTDVVDDNWFAGLHTIFEDKHGDFVVSSSAADAVLVLDGQRRTVKRRMRLPKSIYGENYELTEADNLKDHYIHNDLQLGHLNAAFPDEFGNIWVTTLIQGDVGCFGEDGSYDRILTGYVGAHGVRRVAGADTIYFSDSCHGRLVLADLNGSVRGGYETASCWMHDAQHLCGSLYLLGAPDLGSLLAVNVETRDIQEFKLPVEDNIVQFLSLKPLS